MTAVHRIGYLARVPLRTPHAVVVGLVGQMLGRLPGGIELVVD